MENMDLLPPTAPSLVFARETCTPYTHTELIVNRWNVGYNVINVNLLLFARVEATVYKQLCIYGLLLNYTCYNEESMRV